MRYLAKVVLMIAIWLMAAGSVFGAAPSVPVMVPSGPYVRISPPGGPFYLGNFWEAGTNQAAGRTKVHVVANCPYQIQASLQGLKHVTGRSTMSPKHTTVVINGAQARLGERVQIARSNKPTTPAGVDVPVELKVAMNDMVLYPAGQYSGALVITIMAVP
jgi:hypothetical protein